MKSKLLLLVGLSCTSSIALAAGGSLAGPFAGVQLSNAQATTYHSDNNYWYWDNKDFPTTETGNGIGIRGGYNWVSGSMIFGALGEYSSASIYTVTEIRQGSGSNSYRTGSDVSGFGSIRGRFGYTGGNWAIMGTLGIAIGQIENQYQETDGTGEYLKEKQKTTGTVYGISAEFELNPHAVLAIDYSLYSWGKSTHDLLSAGGTPNGSTFSYEDKINNFSVSYNYKF